MYGWRLKIGIVSPANNVVIEPEFYRALPEGIAIYTTRMLIGDTLSMESLVTMEQNAKRGVKELAATGVDVIVYACLATSLAKGPGWSEAFVEEVRQTTGLPATTAATATMEGLREIGIQRVAMGSAFPASISASAKHFFESYKFRVVSEKCLGVSQVKDMGRIPPHVIYGLARDADVKQADGVCLLATDISTLDVIENLERDLRKPVVTTNQAILWKALGLGGIRACIPHAGRLLAGDR